jgi:CRISPR/Cas system-associated endoribonuclease Cas2
VCSKIFVVKWSGVCFCFHYVQRSLINCQIKRGSGRVAKRISEIVERVKKIIRNELKTSICHLSQQIKIDQNEVMYLKDMST